MPTQRNFQYRGGNPRFKQQNQAPAQFQRNQPRQQGNFRQPVQSLAELGAGPEIIAMCRNWCMEEGYFVNLTIENAPVTFLIDAGLTPPVSLMLGRYKHIKICSDGMKRFYDRNKHFTEYAV